MKSGLPSRPKHVNFSGRLYWAPPTWAETHALADAARDLGFQATVTDDCAVILHGVCQEDTNRRTRVISCRQTDIRLRDIRSLDGLSATPCAEHSRQPLAV